jgi:hypothetical protein
VRARVRVNGYEGEGGYGDGYGRVRACVVDGGHAVDNAAAAAAAADGRAARAGQDGRCSIA